MLDTEKNKQVAIDLLKASAVHDGEGFSELMCDDATYCTVGKPHLFRYAGEKTKEDICAYMSTPSIFDGGVTVTFGEITAEANRVAIEAATRGVLPDGRVYTNTYHYLITLRDGKVLRVKEYLDTQSAAEFFS